MQKWKEIGKRLLFPPVWIILILTIVSTIALVKIFVQGLEMIWGAYVCYVISFYTLVIFCAACAKILPGSYKRIKEGLHKNKYADRYLTDVKFKIKVGLYRSLAINFLYVAVNSIYGFLHQTHWFGIFAVYYGIVAIMQFLLVRYTAKNSIGDNRKGELKRARLCAWILLTVNLALSGAVMMMLFFDRGFEYQGYLIYVIAMYTFYITTTAIVDMVKYRKYRSPIMSITKVIKMASALFSMLFLETAMFAQFGVDTAPEVKKAMIMATGAGIFVVVVSMAVYMIVQTTKELHLLKNRNKTETFLC